MELTKRQWKALVTAYPLYHDEICSQLPSQGTSVDGGNAPRSRGSNVADLTAHTSDEEVPYIVSKVALAFGLPTSDTGPAVHDTLHRSASTRVGVPVLMDKLLRLFFFGEAAVRDKAQEMNKNNELQTAEWTGYGPLGASELYLLGMCAKEQARVRYYSGMYAALTASLQALAAQHPCNMTTTIATTAVCNGGRANYETAAAARMMLPHTTNEERMRQSRQHHHYNDIDGNQFTVNGVAMHDQDEQVSSFTSALAHVPVHHSTTSSMAAFIAQQQPHVFTGNAITSNNIVAAAFGVMAVCEACHEPGGDLFRCSQCNSLLHEICGGPHPPDMGALTGKSGQGVHSSSLTMLCKSCRRALHVGSSSSSSSSTSDEGRKKSGSGSSSSSSSLRSSTSTSEREAIDAYFGPDTSGDEDTSLSGFIVHTDEDEEEENEDEEKDERSERSESEEGQAEPKKMEGSEKQQKQVTQVSSSLSSLPNKMETHKAKRSRSGSAARQHAPLHRRYKLVLSASTSSDDDDDGSVTDV